MGKELSSHWHSGRERKKLKRKVVWGLQMGMIGLATSEFTAVINTAVNWQVIIWMSVHTRVCIRGCACEWICVCCRLCTTVMLGAAMPGNGSLDKRETRCTAHRWFRAQIDITDCNKRNKIWILLESQIETHTHTQACSCSLPQWYCGQQLLVVFRSTARISPFEQVGMGSIHDSHTAQRENKQEHSQIYCCN